ncbi:MULTISPECIES: helix-turn-helix domain-containing protein [Staphylococcus]|uniref:helix-turn-helix domain-containing protein n=1 Tax=Staphylococcus TaxID=1279 RepID=UPI0008A87A43|nr:MULTISPECIES: helix-turn-helix transcriptional regulator [Staphylococcus]RIO87185.1 XRE family transcriptional regulator [Staphylococcus haemolyticus]MCI2896218.1 helix-turn-helix domain-containing protein [Staphylococcus hominis]MDK7299548.1 helix-turn-helix transcriptional regulator [Staphylococcus hominis]MDK7929811.1 helix-turn-helix transcriptional regulator [Staphylococcus hominis]MDS3901040.1 helix-turn-helix transcriptional regulator [Staphylococcus hominis]
MTINLKRLKAERLANGLNQEEMAKRMGWKSRTPYAKRENGLVTIGADELVQMAEILGYSIDELRIFFNPSVPKRELKEKVSS